MENNLELTLNFDNFEGEIQKFVNEKKTFIAYMFGAKNSEGKSWCPDCVLSEPFVEKMKPYIFSMKDKKLVYFINIPMDRDKRKKYKENKILKGIRVPTLAYYYEGKEYGRIIESEMDTQQKVEDFIKQIFEDIE